MRHRKKAAEKNVPSRPLVCAVLDLMVEFIVTHMMKDFPMDLYMRCVQVIHKLICYQKKCRIRLHYTWRELWSGRNTYTHTFRTNTHIQNTHTQIHTHSEHTFRTHTRSSYENVAPDV
uniref:Armadillo-like helical domain-containing protein n=1 Tax=Hucho hucho TaxID=62062 RepID=A0A4W5JYM0_9TELE